MNTNYIDTLPFSPAPPAVMYVDIDSCFATIEQQANPLLRHKPVAVAASKGDHGCILASSIEAKRLGIKTGTRVWEAKNICPSIIVLEPDSNKYRYVNRKLLAILERFQAHVKVRSIDEMSLMFSPDQATKTHLFSIGKIIKQRIAEEIGDYMSVTIGIGPNCSLAKLASNLGKPNGLKEITQHNYVETFTNLPVIELCGIGPGNTRRLQSTGIYTVDQMYQASLQTLTKAFKSVLGQYWYLRLRGYEIDMVEYGRKSYGHSYVLPHATADREIVLKLFCKLVEKMGTRLRRDNYSARGMWIYCRYDDQTSWHATKQFAGPLYASTDLFREAKALLHQSGTKPVKHIAVSSIHLEKHHLDQLSLFSNEERKRRLVRALDAITEKYGYFTVFPATMIGTETNIPDRIAFGSARELETFSI